MSQVMPTMKTYRSALFLVLFSSFFLFGFRIGIPTFANLRHVILAAASQLYPAQSTPNYPIPSQQNIYPAQNNNGQRNILMIGVDQLGVPSPHLEGVWLILYIPHFPQLTLMPIYPVGSHLGNQSNDPSLANLFNLGPDLSPNAKFLEAVQVGDLWWNNYVVFDKIASMRIVDFLGGVKIGSAENVDGMHAVVSLISTKDDPTAALISQARLSQELCHRAASRSFTDVDLNDLFDLLSNHISTDINKERLIWDWLNLSKSGGGISCVYPSMMALSSQ